MPPPNSPSPIEVPPPDDGGAYGSAGFGFQYDCIARLAIAMLTDDTIVKIVCETHEDALIVLDRGRFELVSCKSRDPAKPYNVDGLLGEGGVRHLFESWIRTGEQCSCHLMSEASPSRTNTAADLVDACESRQSDRIQPWAKRLAPKLASSPETVERFLSAFRMTTSSVLGLRQHCGPINATRLRAWLRDSKLSESLDDQCYRLLRDKVQESCRAAVADPLDAASLLDASTCPAESTQRARLAGRTLDRTLVVSTMLDVARGRTLLSGDPAAIDHTRMTLKLNRGEVPQAVVAAARRLRASWYEFESSLALRAPGATPGLSDVRARALLAVADAVASIDLTEPYGQRMYAAVRRDLTTSALSPLPILGLSDELLLGLVFQTTDECELFWSAEFDVDAELA